jgi:hypothetical protein
MQLEQVKPSKNDGKSDENFFIIIFVQAWHLNIFLKSLKQFISAYRPLINKRALICDHS